MGTPEISREPCPDRILDDIGRAFSMGAVGGSVFHFIKGIYNSPRGERVIGSVQSVRMNAPRVGGSFAVWGGLFSAFDCTTVYARQKEDPWNSIIAGAATGGFLSMRQGLGVAGRSAIFGGVLLALIEGSGIMLNRVFSAQQNFPPMDDPNLASMMASKAAGVSPDFNLAGSSAELADDASSSSASSSWFGGFFGGVKKSNESKNKGLGGITEVLESFDSQNTPMPTFEYK